MRSAALAGVNETADEDTSAKWAGDRAIRERTSDLVSDLPDGPWGRGKTEKRRKPRVLIVEDTEDSRELFVQFFRDVGWEVNEAANGEEGVIFAMRFAPDVILMDLGMPVLDGIEATRRLKADPRTREIPVVVFTAFANRSIETEAREAGCETLVHKPCVPDVLLQILENLVRNQRSGV
jgi:CheY-like chemotaxis protein